MRFRVVNMPEKIERHGDCTSNLLPVGVVCCVRPAGGVYEMQIIVKDFLLIIQMREKYMNSRGSRWFG